MDDPQVIRIGLKDGQKVRFEGLTYEDLGLPLDRADWTKRELDTATKESIEAARQFVVTLHEKGSTVFLHALRMFLEFQGQRCSPCRVGTTILALQMLELEVPSPEQLGELSNDPNAGQDDRLPNAETSPAGDNAVHQCPPDHDHSAEDQEAAQREVENPHASTCASILSDGPCTCGSGASPQSAVRETPTTKA